jgi:TPR repeat protein
MTLWLRKSIEHGSYDGMGELSNLYDKGKALPGKSRTENELAGLDLLQLWANKGIAEAQILLGRAYWDGKLGLTKNAAEARRW